MTTAREFITLAMKEAGVLGVGQTLLAEDVNDGFTLLNMMLDEWQQSRWLVPSLHEVSALGNSNRSNLIGPGQYYNAQRPDKIQAAYFKQITGQDSVNNQVSFPLIPIWSYEDYSLLALKNLNSWPQYFFYDNAYPYGNVFIWPIPTDQYSIHLILKSPIGFTIQIKNGDIKAPGDGYVDGVYVAVPIINLTGFGSGGTANITVFGGKVIDFEIQDPGDGYVINDMLTVSNVDLGGTGQGFVWRVTQVTDSLDAEFNMPSYYRSAIHYNLCVRLRSMYQYPPDVMQNRLAKNGRELIRKANLQIPTLKMPPALRFGRGNNFYIFNADAR